MIRNKNDNQKRSICLWVLCLFASATISLLSSCSENKPKVFRVGILSGSDAFVRIIDGFKEKMTELGYVEKEHILYEEHRLNADPDGVRQSAHKFVEDRLDLILAFPTNPALAAKAAAKGSGIPVVFANAGLEGNDLVDNIRRPGGNVTGVRFPGPEQTFKRFEFLLEMVPSAKRIYITWDINYPAISTTVDGIRKAAALTGVSLVEAPVASIEEIKADLSARSVFSDAGIDAVFMMPTLLTVSPEGFSTIMEFANRHKLPVGGSMSYTADKGAIYSYAPVSYEVGELAAPLADKVLKGIPAGTIPVVTAEPRLRVNYKRARELGLTIPEGLLSMAKEIIR